VKSLEREMWKKEWLAHTDADPEEREAEETTRENYAAGILVLNNQYMTTPLPSKQMTSWYRGDFGHRGNRSLNWEVGGTSTVGFQRRAHKTDPDQSGQQLVPNNQATLDSLMRLVRTARKSQLVYLPYPS
jgi:hypothetical protein